MACFHLSKLAPLLSGSYRCIRCTFWCIQNFRD